MRLNNSQPSKATTRPFPPDREVRQALLSSGMRPAAVAWAMSHLLRVVRWDFRGRRKRRLHNLALMRLGMVQLKETLVGIITRHQQETGSPVSVDDLSQGNYKEMLVDFGPAAIDLALHELVREGLVRREKRSISEVLTPTGRPYQAPSLAALRYVLDAMKLSLNVRYAGEYDTQRTYRL